MSEHHNVFYPQQGQLATLQGLYDQGHYLSAYQQASALAPLTHWRGKEGRLMAARIANMLGQGALSRVLFFLAWKEFPSEPEVIYELARNRRSRGIYQAWQFIQAHDVAFGHEPSLQARWLALKGNIAARLRNFRQADAYIRQALALSEDPWLRCEQAYILEFEDRYEESLQVIDRLFETHPDYRPAYQQKAFLLQIMRRDEEASACLQEAYHKFESIHVGSQWLDELIEEGEFEMALMVCDELERWLPLRRRQEQDWLPCRKVDILCHLQRYDEARRLAADLSFYFYTQVRDNLEQADSESRRKVLPVRFIRQQHNTCGPATMSAICNFHGSEVDQQSIIDSIWYAGTTDVDERKWCLEHGWQVTEFKLTWESARALIDAGFPIAVTTVEPDSAHLQAVIGYDEFRGTLLVRDPYERNEQEFLAEGFLRDYAVHGPRAMLIYPEHKASALQPIELPEREQYDLYFRLQAALMEHRRGEALEALQEIESRWPGSRMSWMGRRRLGYYDDDAAYTLQALEQLLESYPDDAGLQLRKQDMLYQLGYVSERKQFLDEVYATGKMHNAILLDYVDVLLQDKRQSERVYQIIKGLLKQRPADPLVYYRLASLRWAQRQFDEALQLHQIAANLADYDEFYALRYFSAARSLHREEEVLAWLQQRHQGGLGKSSRPAITLFKALSQLDRDEEGFAHLQEALAQLPEDDRLSLFLCDKYIESGRLDEAAALLQQIEGKVREYDWLLSKAFLHEQRQDYSQALELRRQVVALQPLRDDQQKRYAELLGQLEGYASKIAYLQGVVEHYPDNFDLYELLYDAMEQATAEEKEALLHKLLAINPHHAWAQRELAIQLGRQLKLDEAFTAIEQAEQLDPHNPGLYTCRASLHLKRHDRASARADYRQALSLSIDHTHASDHLLEISISSEEKRESLAYIRQQLIEQVTSGDAILSYAGQANQVLPMEEVLQQLLEALEARPDLWEAWSVVMRQCQDLQQYEQAEAYARQACERFPYIPRLWLERSRNFRLQGDYPQEQRYLQRALEINPNYATAQRNLADNLEHQGEYEDALALLLRAVEHHQMDAVMHGYLADLQWRMGMGKEALEHITQAVELDPDYNWAWSSLRSWSRELGREEEAETLAARILRQRPGDARAWYQMSRLAQDTGRALECIEQAIALAPADVGYRQEQIKILIHADAYQEALQAYEAAAELTADVDLQLYYPWILRCMGQLDEAVERQQQIMAAHPEHADGWRVLARWARAGERPELELQAAQQYARLEAHDVEALTLYAATLMQQQQVDEALVQYEKALALEPKDVDANLRLFDLYLDHGQIDKAERLLKHMHLHLADSKAPYIDARQGQLYAVQGNKEAALAQLQELARTQENNTWLINSILERMEVQGWLQEVHERIDEWIGEVEQYGPSLTRVWAKGKAAEEDWLVSIDSLARLMAAGEGGVYIVDAYLDYLVEREEALRFSTYVDRNATVLRKHDQTWSTVGYHYSGLGMHDEVVRWMSDWHSRAAPRTWALRSLALSYRHQFRWRQCLEVCRHGLGLEDEGGLNSLHVWSALEYALTDQRVPMLNQLTLIEREDLSPSEGFCLQLIEVLNEAREADDQPMQALAQRLKGLRDGYEYFDSDPPSVRSYRRVCYTLASLRARFPANLVGFFRLYL